MSCLVQAGQMLGTGRLVGMLMFNVPVRSAKVKQGTRRQRQECCGFSEHSRGPSFPNSPGQVKDLGNWVAEIHSVMCPYPGRASFSTLNTFVDEPG